MVFQPGLLDPENVMSIQETSQDNWPFPHIIIQDAIKDSFLRQVRDEINGNLPFKFDENNVYRIQRSTNLANISNPEEFQLGLLPGLIQLRDALYSFKFRKWVSRITAVGPLSGTKSSMAVNLYTPGGHLLVHDDCNPNSKNRRVSYILYLTDPDNPWQLEWGGGLRLYASEPKRNANGHDVKLTLPQWSKNIQPCFNQLIFFAIQPGGTYHEVEEVRYSGDMVVDQDRRRMAVSGWFHTAQEGDEGFDEAIQQAEMQRVEHLHQLKATVHEFHEPQTIFTSFDHVEMDGPGANGILSRQDIDYLSYYLAPQLLTRARIDQMSEYFSRTSMLQLSPFLCEHFAIKLKDYITTFNHRYGKTNEQSNTPSEWKTARPPEAHRYLYLDNSAGPLFQATPISQLITCLLRSHAFKKWLALATGFALSNINKQHVIARRFRRGLDYILADAHDKRRPQLDYTLSITPVNCNHASRYGAGETSGEEIYMSTEHDAIQLMFAGRNFTRTLKDGTGYKNPISWNSFSAILRCDGMQSFVKYVSHEASGDRWDIKGKVQLKGHMLDGVTSHQ
ncbi:65b6fd91-16c8-49d5-8d9c-0d80abfcb06c [Sclerotinia trifoliorum]|uniref:65b6fd91-16c8-49d5-8d9c-0d80abfcb06c n=1 Tax=Sclerotinia trifoliorum TaxID=28548 RepID=A0A8H2VZD7_9HELO|nr:65b6fd91-16c8-49d5-8d9c-0d80abfcb06c [Sclerotinia trifoliorum]